MDRSSTEGTTPPRSAHVQLDDVSRTHDPVELRARVPSARRHDDNVDEAIDDMTEVDYGGGGHRTRLKDQ